MYVHNTKINFNKELYFIAVQKNVTNVKTITTYHKRHSKAIETMTSHTFSAELAKKKNQDGMRV